MNQARHDVEKNGLVAARDAGTHFMDLIGFIPGSSERTSAKARAEEAIAYVQKLIDELE
jgi:hypothetical protein